MNTVKCNMCEWEGEEDDLKIFVYLSDNENDHDIQYFKGCPNCKTDDYLMDINTKENENISI